MTSYIDDRRDGRGPGALPPLRVSGPVRAGRVKGQKGFSLVEILVVLAIFGTLIAIAAPNFLSASFPHMKLKSVSRDVFSMLQYSRSKAVNSTQKYGVRFDLSANPKTYTVVTRAADTDPWTADPQIAYRNLESGVNIFSVTVGGVVYTTGTTAVIVFDPFGSATLAEIKLNNSSNSADRYAVTVSSASGRVKILNTW